MRDHAGYIFRAFLFFLRSLCALCFKMSDLMRNQVLNRQRDPASEKILSKLQLLPGAFLQKI